MEFKRAKKAGKYTIQRGSFTKDDIYDDTAVGSALDSIKKKFENKPDQVQQSEPKKLNPALKPKPLPKKIPDGKLNLGGGGYLQGVVGNDRIPKVNGSTENTGSTVSEKRDRPVIEKTDQTSSLNTKESAVRIINNALSKRDGVREISSIFKGNDDSSHNIPPKITPKPKPVVRRTSDANNNSKSDTKESERTVEKKMTGTVDKENSLQSSSQSSPIGLSVHERAKLLANSGNLPNMKPDLAGSPRTKGIKPPTSEKPISPAGTGSPKRFNIPKNKSQENVSVELRRVMVDSSDVRKILHRKSVKSVIRKSDDKRFRKVELDSISDSGNVPVKPDPIYEEIDWEDLEKEFKRTVQEKEEASKNFPGIGELEEEEFYDDCGNRVPEERISFIEPMTEEDELGDEHLWRKHGFTGLDNAENLPPPPPEVLENGEIQEEYDDVATIKAENNQRDSGGELYEALPDEPGNEPPPPLPGPKPGETKLEPPELPPQPPPEPPRPHKDPKEIEKEKKRKEKEERERKAQEEREEKEKKREQKKREDELKKLGKNFKISMLDLTKSVGQGTIKSTTTKPAKNNLAVQEGDKVEIIRMADPNPKGKFLVRITGSKAVGYVDSSNIEVDTGMIRRLMETGNPDQAAKSSTSSVQEEDLDGENYEDAEGGGEAEELIEDDVYEEFS